MAQTAAARLLSTEDIVLEILHRVSTNPAALFRCSVACKRWRAHIADRSFVRRCWPANASGLLGFFDRQRINVDVRISNKLFFVPPPAGSVFGTHRRLLTSMVDGLLDVDSQFATPHTARDGLLLVRLVSGIDCHESLQMAMCDLFVGTCHILPLLERRFSNVSCTILTGGESGQLHRSVNYFKVLVVAFSSNTKNSDTHEFNLYMFSSTEPRWSTLKNCDGFRKRDFHFPKISDDNIACGGNAHWLVSSFDEDESLKYSTLNVSVQTGHTSLMQLPFLTNQPATTYSGSRPKLGTTPDGSLTLFCVERELHVDGEVWLHTRAIDLNLTRSTNNLWAAHILTVEKSLTLYIIDGYGCMHKINVETGTMEKQQFQYAPSMLAVPMNIEWSTLFASRLG